MAHVHHKRRVGAAIAILLAASTVPAVASAKPPQGGSAKPAQSGPAQSGCDNRNLNQTDKLLQCVNADDAFVHLNAFQDIADANGGTRASGTPGYDQSADYVAGLLEDAGYEVTRQVFDFTTFAENSSSLSADGVDVETQTFSYSGSGSVESGVVIPVDLALGLGNTSTSGCEASDFDGLDFSGDSDIALVQRGACAFGVKATNAAAAGAEAVIIFNQGNAADRTGIIGGTLGEEVVGVVDIPVLDVAYDDGVALLDAVDVSLSADTTIETTTTENVIADLDGVNTDNVVMAGAHLDSVLEGPGINDNGSGSAAILTVALAIAGNEKYTPQNSLRFAFWGAEESGLIGSTEYIFNPEFGISDEDYEALALYLNFDMVGSPNFVYGVYDADESSFAAPVPVPAGSAELEDLFEAYYSINDIPYDDSEFSGRSDYQAFINVGIPASGLFTGAEEIKTERQESIWGGIAGEQFDQCYHDACDTIDNVSFEAMEVNVDAIAYAIYNLAASTEAVNGVAGVDVKGTTPDEVVFDGPQFTFIDGVNDGGLHSDHPVAS
ncbi:M20/M25/M40 family metallo-hydrolase [Ilumatobacter sp.]|uniref:M20/M25/M40 family metallo-hydrolase n=1 Tax=Ilumatobacter sp. TaxID=1967498 RepID=UPI003B524BCA